MSGRSYTEEYRVEAVKLAKEIGAKKAAVELGMPEGTLSGWICAAKRGEIDLGKGQQTPQSGMTLAAELKAARDKIKEIEKDNARLRKENEFLEEATRFFAQSRKK